MSLQRVLLALAAILFVINVSPALAQDETAPPLVRQLYDGNWPSEEEAQERRHEVGSCRGQGAHRPWHPEG